MGAGLVSRADGAALVTRVRACGRSETHSPSGFSASDGTIFEDTWPGAMIAAGLALLLIVVALVAMDWLVG